MKLPLVWKRAIIFSSLILMVLAAFAVFINYRWKPFLTYRLQEAITRSTDSLYSVSFKDINVNILTGNVSIRKIKFKSDTAVYRQLVNEGRAPRHLFNVEIEKLLLKRIHPWKVYFKKDLGMNSIIIEKPVLRMIYSEQPGKQDTVMDRRTAYQRLAPYLRSIRIDHIVLQDADFAYIDNTARRNKVTRLKNLNIDVSGLLIDSASQFDKSKLYYTKDISLSLRDYSISTPDSLYDIKFKEFSLSTRAKYARISGFSLIPRYAEMPFSLKFKTRHERYSIQAQDILLEKINFRLFNSQRKLQASRLQISNGNVHVFTNSELPAMPGDKTGNLPQFALKKFNLDTRIDTVVLKNARVSYAEYNPDSQRKGTIVFNAIEGTITNLSNNKVRLRTDSMAKANLTCLLMGRGRLNLGFDFYLTNPRALFKFTGNLGIMDVEKLNPIIKPLGLVEIRSGMVDNLSFSGIGDVGGVKGSLLVRYNDLKINLLIKSLTDSRLKKRNIASMAANILIIESDNPSQGTPLRKANFNYRRPADKSFFSTIWKGLFMGLQESIGLDARTQRMILLKLKRMDEEKNQREERKKDRFKRREGRRAMREQNNSNQFPGRKTSE